MLTKRLQQAMLALLALAAISAYPAQPAQKKDLIPSPTEKDWLAISKLPDWSGIWVPMTKDQDAQIKSNPTPWTPKVAKLIEWQQEEAKASRPPPLFVDCLPEGMPSQLVFATGPSRSGDIELIITTGVHGPKEVWIGVLE